MCFGAISRGPKCLRSLLFVLTLALSHFGWAGSNIVLVTSSRAAVYQHAVEELFQQIERRNAGLDLSWTQVTLEQIKAAPSIVPQKSDLFITIGSAAAEYMFGQSSNSALLCSFITRNAYGAIAAQNPTRENAHGIFMDQPMERFLALAILLRQKQSHYNIGVLQGQSLSSMSQFELTDVGVNSAMLLADENPAATIEPLVRSNDVFIVTPSSAYINRLVARLTLQLSMRYKKPVIGFSQKYAEAGALLSLYASPEDIGKNTAQTVISWLESGQRELSSEDGGQHYTISLNSHVARKYRMQLDVEQLYSKLPAQEQQLRLLRSSK
jgi:hypothetical protein